MSVPWRALGALGVIGAIAFRAFGVRGLIMAAAALALLGGVVAYRARHLEAHP